MTCFLQNLFLQCITNRILWCYELSLGTQDRKFLWAVCGHGLLYLVLFHNKKALNAHRAHTLILRSLVSPIMSKGINLQSFGARGFK